MSCDHIHVPLYHLKEKEKKIQKKRNIKSGKINKKKNVYVQVDYNNSCSKQYLSINRYSSKELESKAINNNRYNTKVIQKLFLK